MLKKTITYTDYDGNVRTETFHFALNKAEVTEINLTKRGGLLRYIETISALQDGPQIFLLFKELLLKSYGIKSPDGRRFEKSDELRKEFEQTEAYNVLLMELLEGEHPEQAVAAFIEGILPK